MRRPAFHHPAACHLKSRASSPDRNRWSLRRIRLPPDGVPPEEGPDAGVPPAVSDQDEGITQATPEEQEQKDHFVKKAWELIYSDEMWPQVLQMLEGGG